MAKSRQPARRPALEIRDFGADDIERGVSKLKKRIEAVESLRADKVRYDDQRVRNAEESIDTNILEIFGENSPEYRSHQGHRIFHGSLVIGGGGGQLQAGLEAGFPRTLTMLQGLIERLEERRAERSENGAAKIRAAFLGLDLHSRVSGACLDTFKSGNYREAVLNASIALVNYVKERSGRHDLDNAPLMRTVFSKNGPIIAFNALTSQTDLDEQEGFMHLFEGAIMALRNPRAHDLEADAPELAVEYIAFLSLLAKVLDKASKRR